MPGDFFVTLTFQYKELKHCPVALGKSAKESSEILPVQVIARASVIGGRVDFVETNFLVEISILLQMHQAFIDHDAAYPAFETSLLSKLGDPGRLLPQRSP